MRVPRLQPRALAAKAVLDMGLLRTHRRQAGCAHEIFSGAMQFLHACRARLKNEIAILRVARRSAHDLRTDGRCNHINAERKGANR
jgi:hypothetical protein